MNDVSSDNGAPTEEQLAPTMGDRLAKSLKATGMSIGDMAGFLEMHRNTVAIWVRGEREPHPAMLQLWAARTRVPLEWLKTGKWPDTGADPLTWVNQHR
jgi:transcriptional regulator with XRE-family HTH domain